ncbi:uncharacterized protein DS421_1g12140 [Arachis hypogaea]|nr:uncharacterized protein DS421_1g12140 [Arachis hypogaea]
MQANLQVDEKAIDLGSEDSSPTENAKAQCDVSKVLPPKAGEPVADSDVEESGFRPNEGVILGISVSKVGILSSQCALTMTTMCRLRRCR